MGSGRAGLEADLSAEAGGGPLEYFRAMRPHHWIKNLLVFVPLLAAHETDVAMYLAAAGVCVALSACASGGYLFNDLLDLPHDRRHPGKRNRPIAAGRTPPRRMAGIGAVLVTGGLAFVFAFSAAAAPFVLLYVMMTCAYSLWLRRRLFFDAIVLSLLYGIRVLAGAAAVSIMPSPWLLAFSLFAFLALAIAKRQTELAAGRSAPAGRAYVVEDLPMLAALGAASSFATAVVLALYIQSPEVGVRYGSPERLWLLCPLLIHWLGRLTLLANRGVVDDDPVVFAMRDRTSWLTGVAILAVLASAL